MPSGRILTLASLLALAAASLAGEAAAEEGWKYVSDEDGIVVRMRDVPGRGFPTFRGTGIVQASIFDVLAVLSDVKRHIEWMARCMKVRLLRKVSDTEYIIYSQTDAPWPVSDRDAVYHSRAAVDVPRKTVTVRFEAVTRPHVAPVEGIVRMTDLRGHFKFQALGEDRTWVEYEVDADPKGLLPTWLAKLATHKLPILTLSSLRRQVQRTRGWYSERIRRWKAERWREGAGPAR